MSHNNSAAKSQGIRIAGSADQVRCARPAIRTPSRAGISRIPRQGSSLMVCSPERAFSPEGARKKHDEGHKSARETCQILPRRADRGLDFSGSPDSFVRVHGGANGQGSGHRQQHISRWFACSLRSPPLRDGWRWRAGAVHARTHSRARQSRAAPTAYSSTLNPRGRSARRRRPSRSRCRAASHRRPAFRFLWESVFPA